MFEQLFKYIWKISQLFAHDSGIVRAAWRTLKVVIEFEIALVIYADCYDGVSWSFSIVFLPTVLQAFSKHFDVFIL